ncbi:cupin domain-containing protein [Sphingomonas sp.]|uniref:cupin domain-containing protein n=1 Tax=Sphingomonas sp. TaxID=28214 RepID=UPI0025CF2143|nr:cupin domain-containing protein [Sphingomonas sp.]MBV9528704.1 cupin domain-containing protein [Sphingomonas sp.]
MTQWLHALKDIQTRLPEDPAVSRVHYALRHGSMKAGLYAPLGTDDQSPHKQDELYIVASGSGRFVKNGEDRPFQPNDLIFVEAGADHRFVDFTEDFAAWVVFWGPEGGESEA